MLRNLGIYNLYPVPVHSSRNRIFFMCLIIRNGGMKYEKSKKK